jgi:hypothetical protein
VTEAGTKDERVIAVTPDKVVIADTADQDIVASLRGDKVVAARAIDNVIEAGAVDAVAIRARAVCAGSGRLDSSGALVAGDTDITLPDVEVQHRFQFVCSFGLFSSPTAPSSFCSSSLFNPTHVGHAAEWYRYA